MPWAARKIGRPIKWTCERSEAILADEHARDVVTDAEIAFDAQGRILGLRVVNHANVGAYISSDRNLLSVFVNVVTLSGVYRIPAAHVRVNVLMSHCNSTAPYRGAGRPESIYTIERLLDDAATELGIDRVELRRRNIIDSGAFPYKNPFGVSYDCGAFDRGFERMLQMCDHAGFAQRQQKAKARGKLRGIGLASYLEASGAGNAPKDQVQGRFNAQGQLEVHAVTGASGQGHETSFSQIIERELGLPASLVRYRAGTVDSKKLVGNGTGGSRTLYGAGSAILSLSQQLKVKVTALRAELGQSPAVDDWAGGTRIGDALRAFNDLHGRRGLTRGSIVVIVSDGWERGDVTTLRDEMARLRRRRSSCEPGAPRRSFR